MRPISVSMVATRAVRDAAAFAGSPAELPYLLAAEDKGSGKGGGIRAGASDGGGLFFRCMQAFVLPRRARYRLLHAVAGLRRPLVLACLVVGALLVLTCRVRSWTGRQHRHAALSPSAASSSRSGYTVLINTWKRHSLLKQAVAHYASCRGVDAIHVVWSERDPPTYYLKNDLRRLVNSNSCSGHKPDFNFDLNEENNLNNRFKPIKDLVKDAVFSVDDDLIVPCRTLDFAYTVWQSAPDAMVGFVPRMHWVVEQKDDQPFYNYGGWWSVWWTGTYSMVLSKAAFFHRKYLDLYTHKMPSSIHEYVARERNCEDIAMSMLVSNATGASPIWVKGKIYEIGSSGISSLNGHTTRRTKCLNDFISLYRTMPLIPTNVKAIDSRGEWFW